MRRSAEPRGPFHGRFSLWGEDDAPIRKRFLARNEARNTSERLKVVASMLSKGISSLGRGLSSAAGHFTTIIVAS